MFREEVFMSDNNQKTNSTKSTTGSKKEINFEFHKAEKLPDYIFEIIPEPLKWLCKCISDRRRRDIFFLSSLVVTSSHLLNVKILHGDGLYTPSFFLLVIAPPSSGKGILSKSRELIACLQNWEEKENLIRAENLDNYSKNEKNKKEIFIERHTIIPGNISSRAFYDMLRNNSGRGLIFETELDTMTNASSQEWGSFSDITRKAFHHEELSISRQGTKYHISSPDLSICLSGTRDQFSKLFESPSNGNFSRYTFYTFPMQGQWKTHRPTNKSIALDKSLPEASKYLFDIFCDLRKRKTDLLIELNEDQWNRIDQLYKGRMNQLLEMEQSNYLLASNTRMAIIHVRIASILSILRNYNHSNNSHIDSDVIKISDEDFNIAEQICSTLFQHCLILFNHYFNKKDENNSTERYRKWYNALDNEFTTKQATEAANQFEIPVSTMKKWLSNHNFIRIRHGSYRK